MVECQAYSRDYFNKGRHVNGQLSLVLGDEQGHQLAELSIAHDSVRLGRDEIILKDFSENLELTRYLCNTGVIAQTDRYVLIQSHVCPICKVLIRS